jgi:D-glycero-D-manno-heptose 1,7-bisphosphate phosphatase
MHGQSAVFLDKDGTLLDDVAFNVDPARMRFARGAGAALTHLASLHSPLIVVSNQAGIARGLFTEAAMPVVENQLKRMFAECGATLTDFYYCPHDPSADSPHYAVACDCRKPLPGMLLRAAREHGLDTTRSWMIGDILDDIEAGQAAGCRTILIDNGNETEWKSSAARTPTYVVSDLEEAAHIVSGSAQASYLSAGERTGHPA